ncbi:MAG: hypothetical protein GF364_00590, partial [Candidatus Lokiarchaeota archaeon]|nr:hypothetical protein [Candidatus Lokiarchaeota archaeon]
MKNQNVTHRFYGNGIIIDHAPFGRKVKVRFSSGEIKWVKSTDLKTIAEPTDFKIGDYVKHRTFEVGKVINITESNNEYNLTIEFIKYGEKIIKKSLANLERTNKPNTGPAEKPQQQDKVDYISRRMIESFRLGIVPYDRIDNFTFGRNEQIKKIKYWLDDSSQNISTLTGEYGSGKTHMLQYVYGSALKQGFAVSYVEIDPLECPLFRPKKIFAKITQSLQYISPLNENPKNFRSLIKMLLNEGAFKDHRYFKLLLGSSDQGIWEWIEAQDELVRPLDSEFVYDPNYPPLYPYATAANVYTYLLSGLGWSLRRFLGLKGLLVIFDEAESIDQTDYNYQIEKSKNFLNALVRVAQNDPAMENLYSCGLE